MKRWIIIFICLASILFVGFENQPKPIAAAGNTYYVAKTGLDSNDGSPAHPWLTINHAAATAVAGDTVYVHSGTYKEYVFIIYHTGTAGNPITFENYPGDSPIIDGTGLTNLGAYGLITIGQPYINISGFEICNASFYQGVRVANTNHINLTNLKIHDVYSCGVVAGTVTYLIIDGCEFYNCNTSLGDETISLTPASNVEIINCYIHDTNKAGIDCKGSYGNAGCNNISIHDNDICPIIDDCIYIDCQGINQDNYSIYDNKLHDSPDGISIGDEIGGGTLTNVNIYNNLFYNNGVGFAAQPYKLPKTINIINNTFYNNTVGIDWDDTAAQYQVNCVTRNNIVISKTNGVLIGYSYYTQGGVTIDHNLFYGIAGYNTQYGTNYIEANPLLTNPTVDFNIPYNSPAVDAGSSANAPSTDYEGTSRPQGSGYDIGAFEYIPPKVTTSSLPNGTIGVAYLQILTASGGTAPYIWAIASGTLPSGLSLTSGGVISGTPTTADGPTSVTFKVTDSTSAAARQSLSIAINTSPSISTSSLPNGTIGVSYTQTLEATGGTAPYVWTIKSGTLPAGLALSSSGVVSGTPTSAGGSVSVTFEVTDSATAMATKMLTVTVNNTPPSISTSYLTDGTVGVAYSQTLAATGGTFPLNWTIASGTLPPGLSLSSSGVIYGTPTKIGGTASVTFQVTDGTSASATQSLSITIYGIPPSNITRLVLIGVIVFVAIVAAIFLFMRTRNWL